VRAEESDVEYILSEVQRAFSRGQDGLWRHHHHIRWFAAAFAYGEWIEALIAPRAKWQIIHHGSNFMSIAGGKYTTYRAEAEKIVD